jgi:hypothetical protein
MRRHFNVFLIQAGAKPFTNFLAERRVMDAANLTVTFVRRISHENPIYEQANGKDI